MISDYIVARCPRCSSTSEIISSGVMTDVFLCPVCLEGEIKCRKQQPVIERVPGSRQGNQKPGYDIAAVGGLATNPGQQQRKGYVEGNIEAFSLWGKGLYLN